MRRALAIDEANFEPHHPKIATRINNLAVLLQATNRLSDAEPLIRALELGTRRRRVRRHRLARTRAAAPSCAANSESCRL
jgi:Flp pilus assembly protein TadD